jgi:hypothetical protein
MIKYYVDGSGNYLGGFEGTSPPGGSTEVPSAPQHASQIWNFGSSSWSSYTAPNPYGFETFVLSSTSIPFECQPYTYLISSRGLDSVARKSWWSKVKASPPSWLTQQHIDILESTSVDYGMDLT